MEAALYGFETSTALIPSIAHESMGSPAPIGSLLVGSPRTGCHVSGDISEASHGGITQLDSDSITLNCNPDNSTLTRTMGSCKRRLIPIKLA